MKRITKISDIVNINKDIEEKERKERARINADEYSIFCPLCGKEGPSIVKADLGVYPNEHKIKWVTDCCTSETVENKYGNVEPAYNYKPEPPTPPEPRELREIRDEQIKLIDKEDIRAMRIKNIYKVSAKTPDKLPTQHEIYKTIRKPAVKPGYVMDDGQGYHRKMKDLGDNEGPLSLQELMDEADKLAKIKGHMLSGWKKEPSSHGLKATCFCVLCDKQVNVIENPTSEEDDISGSAILEDCGENISQPKEIKTDLTNLLGKIKDEFLKNAIAKPTVYKDPKHPCPKCGSIEHIILNPSMPIINQCVQCQEMFNPDNQSSLPKQ